jgi:hypothetical protein
VSRLWPDLLSVYVAPGRITALSLRCPGGAVLEQRAFEVDARPGADATALQSGLARVLREMPQRRLRVVLSSHLVQYRLLPWRDDLRDADEDAAFARNQFASGYGDRTEDLAVSISHERPGRPRIVAAVPTSALAAIRAATDDAGTTIVSLQPCLTAVAHSVRHDLGQQAREWLVVHEDQKLSLALLEDGQWRWVRSLQTDVDWPVKLAALLAAESLRAGLEQNTEFAVAVDVTAGVARLPDNASPRRPVSLAIRRQVPLLDGTEFTAALAGM